MAKDTHNNKTIFLSVSGKVQARNLLRSDTFTEINENKNIRIILFVPAYKMEDYKKEFVGERLIIEGIPDCPTHTGKLNTIFKRLSIFYINTATVRHVRRKWLFFERKQPVRYGVSLFFLFLFGNIKPLRRLARFLDYTLVADKQYAEHFHKYHPDLIVVSNIALPIEQPFLRQAKRHGVASVGMIQSWDNITLSRSPFRLLPDTLIVHNEILKKEAIQYLDMKEHNIFVSGLPHFDRYRTETRSSREIFCKRVGIDPSKKILLFGSVALINDTEWQVLYMLDQAMQKGQLPKDVTVLLRHHPITEMHTGNVTYSNRVVFDDSKTRFRVGKREYTEILKHDTKHLADSIFHSAMIITTSSTLAIDGSALDTPIVDIGFDGWEDRPLHKSVRRYYTPYREFYQNIVNTGGVTVAYTFEELLRAINCYLENPALHKEGRERIVREQCYKLDGKSGKRISDYILEKLNS